MRANLFSKVINASKSRHMFTTVSNKDLNFKIISRFYDYGFIEHFCYGSDEKPYAERILPNGETENIKSHLWVRLKYTPQLEPVLKDIRMISKPSRRVFATKEELITLTSGKATNRLKSLGLGRMLPGQVMLVNTNKHGVIELFEAVEKETGGEVMCIVH
eukprot:NODE_185_length_13590_cov_0.472908.p10 type:complete len:160 gc:universal NODE_185_length_13590_cov_0.472908:9997-10476(+)